MNILSAKYANPDNTAVDAITEERGSVMIIKGTDNWDLLDGVEIVPFVGPNYKEMREVELEPLDGEGMDAIRKEIAAIRSSQPEDPAYKAYREKVEVIKVKYPKE